MLNFSVKPTETADSFMVEWGTEVEIIGRVSGFDTQVEAHAFCRAMICDIIASAPRNPQPSPTPMKSSPPPPRPRDPRESKEF